MNKRVTRVTRFAALSLLVAMVASPQVGSAKDAFKMSAQIARHLSGAVSSRYYLSHPDQAPAAQQTAYREAARLLAQPRGSSMAAPTTGGLGGSDVFNLDDTGLSQNEESVSVCGSRPNLVISGTNDYRGLLDPEENFTGWDLSTDGGGSVAAEGLLPHLDFGSSTFIPSGGDPVYAFDNESCAAYAANLNYDVTNYFPNGIGVYSSTPATLKSCPSGSSDPACWPSGIVVAQAPDSTHFLDKEWMDVGNSGTAGKVVWVTWSDFLTPDPATSGVFTASIWAARCDALLTACTAPISISGTDEDVQFSYVTVGSDGRVYVTWAEIQGELTGVPETFVIKMRIADAGTTTFGPTQVVATVGRPIGFDNTLYGQTFRVATVPKNTMLMADGVPHEFVVWEQCGLRPLGYCQDPSIRVASSDDDGVTWKVKKVSVGGDNYFPSIDAAGRHLAVAYFTSRYDSAFGLAQDVELVTVDPATLAVTKRQRLTSPSNNPNADWLFSGGIFIGDYIQVAAHDGMAYVAYNANYQRMKFLGIGRPEGQQDNYLTVVPLG